MPKWINQPSLAKFAAIRSPRTRLSQKLSGESSAIVLGPAEQRASAGSALVAGTLPKHGRKYRSQSEARKTRNLERSALRNRSLRFVLDTMPGILEESTTIIGAEIMPAILLFIHGSVGATQKPAYASAVSAPQRRNTRTSREYIRDGARTTRNSVLAATMNWTVSKETKPRAASCPCNA